MTTVKGTEPVMPKSVRQKQYKRSEDWESFSRDLQEMYKDDPRVWPLIDSYVHSPLLVERQQKPEDKARRDFGTIKQLLQEAYREQEECKF